MGFGDAVKVCFSKYADGKGRAARPEYWWFFLSYIIVYIVAAIIGGALKASWLVCDPAARLPRAADRRCGPSPA